MTNNITREQIRITIAPVLVNIMNYPEEIGGALIGRDFSGVIEKATNTIFDLVNGTDE